LVIDPPSNLVVSTGFAVITPVAIGPSLLYGLTERAEFVEYLVANAGGSTYPAIRAERLADAPVSIPNHEDCISYEKATMPMRRLAAKLREESGALAHLRNTLLPELISGRIRVRDIAKASEELSA
jgi:type I restriction enzyme S subunit